MFFDNNDHLFQRTTIIKRIETSLEECGFCVVRGESGIGKSYLASQFSKQALEKKKFKHVLVINVSDDNIEKSIHNIAQETGLDIQDESSKPLTANKLFKMVWERIENQNFKNDFLVVFEDAEIKFFNKCYDHARNIRMLILTKCEEELLSECRESAIIHLQPYNNDEGRVAVKKFLDQHNLIIHDQSLYDCFVEKLRGFPLAIYQVLNKIKFRVVKENRRKYLPIDDIMKEYIGLGNNVKNVKVIKEIDDPHLQLVSVIVKTSFERLIALEEGLGRAARKLFQIMSYMDSNFLFDEMFRKKDGNDTDHDYGNALDTLEEMKLLTYEER